MHLFFQMDTYGYGSDFNTSKKYQYWFATWNNPPEPHDLDCKVDAFWSSKKVAYARGQLEKGEENNTIHWQFLVYYTAKNAQRLSALKRLFGNELHWQPCKSEKAEEYVWKDNSSLGHRFEWGKRPFKFNSKMDHEECLDLCKQGKLDQLPAKYLLYHYQTAKKIKFDYMKGEALEKEVNVYWGNTGLGKSRKAWTEAGLEAYPKAPTTKFWDGYQGESFVVIDEFTGQIEISHMLRWLDRYPVLVEQKGSGCVLKARRIWITSNVDPEEWYRTAPPAQVAALLRRMKIVHFTEEWTPEEEEEEATQSQQ